MIRELLSRIRRAYQLAVQTPQRRTPPNTEGSANRAWREGMPALRRWGRHFEENSDLANGCLDDLVELTIGPGIQVFPMARDPMTGALDDAMNEQLAQVWEEWSELPEVSTQLHFSEVQRLGARAFFRDGEAFFHHVGAGRGYPFEVWPGRLPFALELLESDFVPHEVTEVLRNGRRIVNGIEVDTWGRPLAYRVAKEHPGTQLALTSPMDYKRIPVDQMTHIAYRKRYGQLRGVTVFHAAGRRLHDLSDYDESERISARTQARIAFWRFSDPISTRTFTSDDPDGGDGNQRTLQLPQGTVLDELQPGEDIKFAMPSRPNAGISDWRADQIRALAAGTGTRYSRISRQYQTSYTAQRAELVDAAHAARGVVAYFVNHFIAPIRMRVIQTALITGRLENPAARPLRELLRAEYIPPGIPWIQPDQEVTAALEAINGGLITREQVIMQNGRDPRKVPEVDTSEQQATTPADATSDAGD